MPDIDLKAASHMIYVEERKSGVTFSHKGDQTDVDKKGDNVGMAWIAFCSEQAANHIAFSEDGFSLLIDNSTFSSISQSLQNSQELSLPGLTLKQAASTSFNFSIRWNEVSAS